MIGVAPTSFENDQMKINAFNRRERGDLSTSSWKSLWPHINCDVSKVDILGHVHLQRFLPMKWMKLTIFLSFSLLRTQPQQPWSSLLPSFPSPLRHLPSPPLVLPLPPDRLHLVVLSVRLLPPFPSVVKRKFIYFLQWHKLYMNNNVVWTIAMDLLLYCNSLSSDKSLLSFIFIY